MARELNALKYDAPLVCSKCGGSLKYSGVGEYKCQECGHVDYDDYGKVRNYIETYHGATQAEVAEATGVSVNRIRQMLRDEKIEVAANSVSFLHCEGCGIEIRSGRYCAACEMKMHKTEEKPKPSTSVHGYGRRQYGEAMGERRFKR